MFVSIEISYYPLSEDFDAPVDRFIGRLDGERFTIEYGAMSTVISGEYRPLMKHLEESMGELLERQPSVFTLKLSNACIVR